VYRATARRPGGFAQIVDPDLPGGHLDADTLTCGHCGAVVSVANRLAGSIPEGGGCYQCGQPICEPCVTAGVCLPFEAWLDQHEGKPLKGRWAESFAAWQARRR
jgi:hypothetical protein